MKYFRSPVGRRQFVLGGLAASALGLAAGKVKGAFSTFFGRGVSIGANLSAGTAAAAEGAEESLAENTASDRYRHLLSPLQVGNVVVKNRTMQTDSYPRFSVGTGDFSRRADHQLVRECREKRLRHRHVLPVRRAPLRTPGRGRHAAGGRGRTFALWGVRALLRVGPDRCQGS